MSKKPSAVPPDPRRIVINDASCLIDLQSVGLLLPMLSLPFDFRIALPVRQNELLTISPVDWARIERAGMTSVDLPAAMVAEAFVMQGQYSKLSPEDCFSLVLARSMPPAILLTGDMNLRKAAEIHDIEVHGVLWIWDLLHAHQFVDTTVLFGALKLWQSNPLVRLPIIEIEDRMRKIK